MPESGRLRLQRVTPRPPLPRIYPILDSAAGPWPRLGLAPSTTALLAAGARILQFRHKGQWTRTLFEAAREAARLCREAGAVPIIDDRADVAALIGAGVHLGQDDLPPCEARRLLGDGAVVGFSTHNPGQLRAAAGEPADYLALGPIFSTSSKRNPDPVVGLGGLRLCRGITGRPLVAIGGITRQNATAVLAAGAGTVAVIGDMVPDPLTPETLRNRMEEWMRLVRA
jgi:thiamine-phosphate pyrophosphorylase